MQAGRDGDGAVLLQHKPFLWEGSGFLTSLSAGLGAASAHPHSHRAASPGAPRAAFLGVILGKHFPCWCSSERLEVSLWTISEEASAPGEGLERMDGPREVQWFVCVHPSSEGRDGSPLLQQHQPLQGGSGAT